MTEQWKPVVGYEDRYEISSEGRVYSHISDRLLKPYRLSQGHLVFCACRQGVRRTMLIHRAMLEAFVRQPESGEEACHNNDVPWDNRLENLRWASHRENMIDVVRNGNHHTLLQTHCKNGHEFTPENTHIYQRKDRYMTTERRCRACRYTRTRKWLATR